MFAFLLSKSLDRVSQIFFFIDFILTTLKPTKRKTDAATHRPDIKTIRKLSAKRPEQTVGIQLIYDKYCELNCEIKSVSDISEHLFHQNNR